MTDDLNAAVDRLKSEAYQQGWDDCADAILKAARAGKAPKRGKGPRRTPAEGAAPAPSADVGEVPEMGKQPTEAEARAQGRQHAQDGFSRALNPYFRGSKGAQWWDEGWLSGEAHHS